MEGQGGALSQGDRSKLEPHQERVCQEHWDLGDKLGKLQAFIKSETFKGLPRDEQLRLHRQEAVMWAYLEILRQRIEAF